jgi:hypothetical protein
MAHQPLEWSVRDMAAVTFRWSRKAKWTCLGLGLITAAISLVIIDVCTFDFLRNNPVGRYGDMRPALPSGSVLEMMGVVFHDLLALFLILGGGTACYLGFYLAGVSAIGLLSPMPAVVIGDDGVWNWYWSDTLVPWSAIRRIDGFYREADGSPGVSTFVTFVVDDPATYLARSQPFWRQRVPFFIKQLSVSLVVLEDPVGFIEVLIQRTPDHIPGVKV